MASYPLDKLETIFFADLAAGKDAKANRKKTARQTIVGCARDWLSRFFVIYAWAGRETATTFKDKILDVYEEYQPIKFGIEANGMQVLFGSLIRQEARDRFGKSIRIVPIYQPTNVDKDYRIRMGLQPVIRSGRLFTLSDQIELASEITGHPTAATKDLVDALETVIRIAPKQFVDRARNVEVEQYAEYLRNSGFPAHAITKELEDYAQRHNITLN